MDISFLILVVAPLCVYVVLILYSVKDIESSDTPSASEHALPPDAAAAHDVPAAMESAPHASPPELAPPSASIAATETARTREAETVELTPLQPIRDTIAAEAPPPSTAAAESITVVGNADMPMAERIAPAIALAESDAAAAPPPYCQYRARRCTHYNRTCCG